MDKQRRERDPATIEHMRKVQSLRIAARRYVELLHLIELWRKQWVKPHAAYIPEIEAAERMLDVLEKSLYGIIEKSMKGEISRLTIKDVEKDKIRKEWREKDVTKNR